jgi:inosine-uridine nucleoside N-ribohydrolase
LPETVPAEPRLATGADADALLQSLMENAAGRVTLLVTCPFTPIMNLLQRSPDLAAKLERSSG